MFSKKTVKDIELNCKKVLLRSDLNVPLDENGEISDELRIIESLPTIRYLLEHKAAVIICSHLGRPGGQRDEKYSLKRVNARLAELLGREIPMAMDVIGDDAVSKAAALKPGEILMLENLRFCSGEFEGDPDFAKKLASMAELYVGDAFGTCHRNHASIALVADYIPAVSGLLVVSELEKLSDTLDKPKRPFVVVLGGVSIADKLGLLESLMYKADTILIGGGLAFTFIKAKGGHIGLSVCDDSKMDAAKKILERAKVQGVEIILPVDAIVADTSPANDSMLSDSANIDDEYAGVDIGRRTNELFCKRIAEAGTVLWNGSMGMYEIYAYTSGTRKIAQAIADCKGATIVCGEDSVAEVRRMGLQDKITLVSTGGMVTLNYLEGKPLPGVTCLMDK